MKKTIICLLLMLAFQESFSQFSFKGKVYDEKSLSPVANAIILLGRNGQDFQNITDEKGYFVFENLVAGDYVLRLNHVTYIFYFDSVSIDRNISKEYYLKANTLSLLPATVSAIRANRDVPTTATNLNKSDIRQLDNSKDFPYLLNLTPSTVINSDAGNGVGYTGIRIRGIDPTRINVTINGIPLNDAEGQGVFWVNLPDLASSSQSVQIQRGVGTSTNGAAAFGGSVNISTDDLAQEKFIRVTTGLGSFNTVRTTLSTGSGIKNGWAIQGRTSFIHSDGFIDRAASNLRALNLTAGKMTDKSMLKMNVMLGRERTYQAWYGMPQPKFEQDREELERYIQQLYIAGEDEKNLRRSAYNTYNYYLYENEVDDYSQRHFQLFYNLQFNEEWKLNTALHYTMGKGFYEQFRSKDDLVDYGMAPYISGVDTFYSADLERRRWLDNDFYGTVLSLLHNGKWSDFSLGAAINRYDGRHFGELISTEFTEYDVLDNIYYDNQAEKVDANIFTKLAIHFGKWHPYIDLQYRAVAYQFEGPDQNGELTDQDANFGFFNPKGGISYFMNKRIKFYALYAIGNREPVRDDFIESTPESRPMAERLDNMELGMELNYQRIQLYLTLYDMQYKNALVLNGQINDVGAYTRVNVGKSYRRGIELSGMGLLMKKLQLGGNLTLSDNKIATFTEYIDDWDNWGIQESMRYENTDIAFSPSIIAAAILHYDIRKNFYTELNLKHVGKQYLDNTQSEERMLEAFQTLNLSLMYSAKKEQKTRSYRVGLFLENLLNEQYAPNGYTFSGLINGERENFNYVYPMAGINWMLKMSIDL